MHANLLAAADVLLLSERPSQIDMSLPSKLTAYYAAGRPIVAAVGLERRFGGGGRAVRGRAGGPRRAAGALLEALARLRDDPTLAAALAAAGPAYAETHTGARHCLARAASLVDLIAGREPTADATVAAAA